MRGGPKNPGVDPFPDSVGHFGVPDAHFGFCRRSGVAGGAVFQALGHCRRCSIAGSAALQAVWCCRQCGVASSEQGPGAARLVFSMILNIKPNTFVMIVSLLSQSQL